MGQAEPRTSEFMTGDVVLATAPIGRNRLQVRRRGVIGKEYDAPARLERCRLVLRSSRAERSLRSLVSVPKVASDLGLDIAEEVRRAALAFAEVVASWKGLGVVIQPTFRFSYLRNLYGKEPVGPTLRGNRLRFFVTPLCLDYLRPPLKQIDVDISSFRVVSRVVAKVKAPKEPRSPARTRSKK